MARNRMIKPEFWEDEKIGALSVYARLLFLSCLNFADDEGFIRWNKFYLASKAFIYDENIQEKIEIYMKELENQKLIVVYKANNTTIGLIKNFKKHQKIDKPQKSKFPKPSKEFLEKNCLIFQEEINSENNSENNSANGSANNSENKEKEKENKNKKRKEEREKEKEREKEDLQAKRPLAQTQKEKPLIPQQVLWEYFAQKYKALTGQDYLRETKDFVILAELLKKTKAQEIRQKIDWLEIGCRNAVFWFSKDKGDFTIGTLKRHWNEIQPKLTQDQKKAEEEYNRKKKLVRELQAQGVDIEMEDQGSELEIIQQEINNDMEEILPYEQ